MGRACDGERMDIGALGISYKSSDLALRERFAAACDELRRQRRDLSIVVLSTCNRTEIYFSAVDVLRMYSLLLQDLQKRMGEDVGAIVYSYFGEPCFWHIARVCCGIDSVVFGEAQIQRQVKRAYEEAVSFGTLSSPLHFLFQKSLKIGKQMRTHFHLPTGNVCMESILWELCHLFFRKDNISILFVGYSQINRTIVRFFRRKSGVNLYLATRSIDDIDEDEVAKVSWKDIASWTQFDVVICASKHTGFVLCSSHLPAKQEEIHTRLIVDLGVPRNVDPCLGENSSISLLNIEDVGGLIAKKQGRCSMLQKTVAEKVQSLASWQYALYHQREGKIASCI